MVLLIYNQGNDDTYEVPGRYSEVAMVALADVKRLVTYIAWLWHYIAPCQGNFLPLPGKKRHVGRKKEKQQEGEATRRRSNKKEKEEGERS